MPYLHINVAREGEAPVFAEIPLLPEFECLELPFSYTSRGLEDDVRYERPRASHSGRYCSLRAQDIPNSSHTREEDPCPGSLLDVAPLQVECWLHYPIIAMPPIPCSTYIFEFYVSCMNECDAESRKNICERENAEDSKAKKMEVAKYDMSEVEKKG
ncbi:hypothetical protein Cgig2_002367 [Carnegiea gigantea]|uniref:Uncharacterized protein n=1 Tax=Carnegiea gigantea TaxID=171969 RepID=A0A9Q1KEJ8_9CARY|nr:hypothetical protein Cgig2_002367 [Carnegiea gigantea]